MMASTSTASATAVAGAFAAAAGTNRPRGSAACPRVPAGGRRRLSCVVRCDAGPGVQAQAAAKAASVAALEQFKISADQIPTCREIYQGTHSYGFASQLGFFLRSHHSGI